MELDFRYHPPGQEEPIIKPLLAELEGATSYDDPTQRLAHAVVKMDHTDLVNLLAPAGFNVNFVGQAGVKIRGI